MEMDCMTDDQVEAEIERLTHSEYVRIAKAEQRAKYHRRQYMYKLRVLEKRGKLLSEQGMDENYFGDGYTPDGDFSE